MGKIIIEMRGGKIVGVYGSEEMKVVVYEDLKDLSDKQIDELKKQAASVPYILYQ